MNADTRAANAMIEHAKCPRCGALSPLDDGVVLLTLEDDEPIDESEFEMDWQCMRCCLMTYHRCELTIVALHRETRLPGLVPLLPGGWA